MKNYTHISFWVLFLVSSFTSHAQEPIYKHFGVDEGLPSSEVYDIYQDKQGYIWFATDKGLSRYNGYEFENFDTNDGLPGNVVLRFYPQVNGEIWAYTYHNKALFYFNENFDGFTIYKHNTILYTKLHSNSVVKSVFVDASRTLHIGGNSINGKILVKENGEVKQLYSSKNYFDFEKMPQRYVILNDKLKTKDAYYTTTNEDIINNSFFKSKSKSNNAHICAFWLIQNKKAVFMDGESIQIIGYNTKAKIIKYQQLPLGIKVIDSAQFFVGNRYKGCKILNDKGDVLRHFLKEKSVTNFLIDYEGGYWFTTLGSGVYYIKNPSVEVFLQPNKNNSFHINSLVKKEDELLIGYKDGDLAKIDSNNVFKLIKEPENLTPSIFIAPTLIEYDTIKDNTYVFRNHRIEMNEELVTNLYIIKFSEPSAEGTVFASHPTGFYSIDKNKDFKSPFRVLDVSLWKTDTLIASPFGVFKKNKDSLIPLSHKSKLLGYRTEDIDVSKNGDSLYIATQGAGIVVYGKRIYNISKENGLSSDIINEIHIENDSTIWACTNKGLNRVVFNSNSFSVTNIDKEDGLLSNEVEDLEIINDMLWVGTKDGLCYMPKSLLDDKPLDAINLKLKAITVNDRVYANTENPELSYDQNKITFLVEGVLYAKHSDLIYQYRIKETDTKWNTTKNRTISFPNLKYGTYTFQVKACIGSKCYTENQIEYSFKIKPPFWKSGWFYAFCILVFSGLIALFFKIRLLTYNKDVTREFIRLLIKRLKRDEKFLEIRMNGEDIKTPTNDILFIKSSGNYLDIISTYKTYTIRCKIGDFVATTPDVLEYLRVHRSYIIRIDKVTGKSKNSVTIKEHTIPVGETYLSQLDKIQF